MYAIALTLLAVDLILPQATADLHGDALLRSLLEDWPKLLAFLTSFTVIANFWVGHLVLFQHVRRFDGGLMWLALLQLLCIAFIPFPTSVIGEHVGDPVAQQFYFGTILVTGLVMVALWRYMNSRRPLVHPDLSPQYIRRTDRISLALPATFLVFMVLVAVGIGKVINPLLLSYIVALLFIALGILEWRNSEPADKIEPDDAPADKHTEDRDRTDE
ncbi:MAG: DUF1211 domain-containing protein [Rubrobacter sp.]|nr:DUF1211 domain-containing protein [Rubrobacter sp.]